MQDTIVAQSTPSGESAIAVARVSGELCEAIALSIFNPSQPIKPRYTYYGNYKDLQGNILDDVIWVYFPPNKSYTAEAMLEISMHGNPLIIKGIIDDLLARDCRMAEGGEFTKRAYLAGKMDLTQAEAVCDIISASSNKALEMARRQREGTLGQEVSKWIKDLIQTIAELEAYIDFPEEDLPEEDTEGPVSRLAQLRTTIESALATRKCRSMLYDGLSAVIVGAPNAGKSTLFNHLLGENRTIVSDQAGTTRDTIKERIYLEEHAVDLLDTAGLRTGGDNLEQEGMRRAIAASDMADIFVLVIDASEEPPTLDPELTQRMTPENTLIIYNKEDLGLHPAMNNYMPEFSRCTVSLETDAHIPQIRTKILEIMTSAGALGDDTLFAINLRHEKSLQNAFNYIDNTLNNFKETPTELIVSDLRDSIDELGEITGKVDNEAILDTLFSSFCIGK